MPFVRVETTLPIPMEPTTGSPALKPTLVLVRLHKDGTWDCASRIVEDDSLLVKLGSSPFGRATLMLYPNHTYELLPLDPDTPPRR